MRKYDSDKGLKLLLALIYPFGAFLLFLRDLRSRSSFGAIFIFFVMFGICFTANKESSDSFRYMQDYLLFSLNPDDSLRLVLMDFFGKDPEVKDLFVYFVYYISSFFFGSNYHGVFFLVSIVFAAFLLLSLHFITNDRYFKNDIYCFLLIFVFYFSNPISNINGVRFFTAMWIAVYITFQIIVNNNRKYFILFAILPFVHLSFYVYIVFFVVAYFAKKYYKFLPIAFFVSFFTTDIALQFISDFTDYMPSNIQMMIWSYTSSESALERIAGEVEVKVPLYARVLNMLPKYFFVSLLYLLVRNRPYFKEEKSKEMLDFILALGTAINVSSTIPSMGRYWAALIPLTIFLWIRNKDVMIKYKKYIYVIPIVYAYPLFQSLRFVREISDPLLFLTNVFHIFAHNLLV